MEDLGSHGQRRRKEKKKGGGGGERGVGLKEGFWGGRENHEVSFLACLAMAWLTKTIV